MEGIVAIEVLIELLDRNYLLDDACARTKNNFTFNSLSLTLSLTSTRHWISFDATHIFFYLLLSTVGLRDLCVLLTLSSHLSCAVSFNKNFSLSKAGHLPPQTKRLRKAFPFHFTKDVRFSGADGRLACPRCRSGRDPEPT